MAGTFRGGEAEGRGLAGVGGQGQGGEGGPGVGQPRLRLRQPWLGPGGGQRRAPESCRRGRWGAGETDGGGGVVPFCGCGGVNRT